MSIGTRGTYVGTHNDSENGTGSGAITYTLSNATVTDEPRGGPHQDYGQGTLQMEAKSNDGATSPLSLSVAA